MFKSGEGSDKAETQDRDSLPEPREPAHSSHANHEEDEEERKKLK